MFFLQLVLNWLAGWTAGSSQSAPKESTFWEKLARGEPALPEDGAQYWRLRDFLAESASARAASVNLILFGEGQLALDATAALCGAGASRDELVPLLAHRDDQIVLKVAKQLANDWSLEPSEILALWSRGIRFDRLRLEYVRLLAAQAPEDRPALARRGRDLGMSLAACF